LKLGRLLRDSTAADPLTLFRRNPATKLCNDRGRRRRIRRRRPPPIKQRSIKQRSPVHCRDCSRCPLARSTNSVRQYCSATKLLYVRNPAPAGSRLAINLEELRVHRDVLLAVHYRGLRPVEMKGRRVIYAFECFECRDEAPDLRGNLSAIPLVLGAGRSARARFPVGVAEEESMHSIIYIVGFIVVILFILSFLGLR
jgi:hypothetical protein